MQESPRNMARYAMPHRITLRLGEYEVAMLESMSAIWNCSRSEAIRRSIVYTFSKIVAGLNKLDEESIVNAVELALSMYDEVKKRRLVAGKEDRRKKT